MTKMVPWQMHTDEQKTMLNSHILLVLVAVVMDNFILINTQFSYSCIYNSLLCQTMIDLLLILPLIMAKAVPPCQRDTKHTMQKCC